jgi:predicted  nucleic acid-binding Zn-ribbon protein
MTDLNKLEREVDTFIENQDSYADKISQLEKEKQELKDTIDELNDKITSLEQLHQEELGNFNSYAAIDVENQFEEMLNLKYSYWQNELQYLKDLIPENLYEQYKSLIKRFLITLEEIKIN